MLVGGIVLNFCEVTYLTKTQRPEPILEINYSKRELRKTAWMLGVEWGSTSKQNSFRVSGRLQQAKPNQRAAN